MKKLRTTLVVCLTALAVLTAFGCKGAQDVGADAGKWGGQSVKTDGQPKTLKIIADNGGIDFYCFTDKDGVVVTGYKGTETPVNKGEEIIVDFSPIMTDKTTETYTLYIHQPDVKPTKSGDEANAVAGSRDFRGTVTIQSGAAVEIKASNYKDEIVNVGIVKIVNDEPTSKSRYPDGDYTITELRALQPNGDGTYSLSQSFTRKCNIAKNETVSFVFPANESDTDNNLKSFVALVQPRRTDYITSEEQYQEIKAKGNQEASWGSTLAEEREWDANRFFTVFTGVPKHKTTTLQSSTCAHKLTISTDDKYVVGGKAAVVPPTYILELAVPGEK